jgi:hypothetical protein
MLDVCLSNQARRYNMRIETGSPANVVKANNFIFLVPYNDETKTCHFILHIITNILVSRLVRDEKPVLGEDCAAFKLVYFWEIVHLTWYGRTNLFGDSFLG